MKEQIREKETQESMLASDLSAYIATKHTQEECIGFIDGYKAALSKSQSLNNQTNSLLIAMLESQLKVEKARVVYYYGKDYNGSENWQIEEIQRQLNELKK